MMNRPNSTDSYVPSMMSFVGLEGSSAQKSHLWDWETPTQNSSPHLPPPNSNPFFSTTPFIDSQPPLLPMNSFPFYSPVVPEYPSGLIKREEPGGGVGRIGLNLGHRTYFSSGDALTIDRLFAARTRGVYSLAHHQPPRCQAEGCKADLSGAKHYHRRHKVCEFHSKATVVIAGGMQQRFCQQCSRFHVLAEFDEAKRSCRKRLADHNRRRRKPQIPPPSDPSASKNTEKNTQTSTAPKPTRDITTSKANTTTSTSVSNGSSVMEGYQSKATHLRNGPALSLGGVEGSMEKGGGMGGSHQMSLYQQQQGFYGVMSEEKASSVVQHHFPSPSSSNSNYFYHQNLFGSSSNEASQSTGGGSDHNHQQHQSNLLHLGQAMFEVDFM